MPGRSRARDQPRRTRRSRRAADRRCARSTCPTRERRRARVDGRSLFVDRAREAGGRFELDESDRAAVAQICTRRLDGIPLALELAAARTRMMTPAEIAARLDERFRLLTGGSRTAVERHQTLRQAVDWSYDLLEPRERVDPEPSRRVRGRLHTRRRRSGRRRRRYRRVRRARRRRANSSTSRSSSPTETATSTRYRLLETIRQYALERLDEEGVTDSVRRRHAEWCAELHRTARRSVYAGATRWTGSRDSTRRSTTSAPASPGRPRWTTPTSPCARSGHFTPVQLMFRRARVPARPTRGRGALDDGSARTTLWPPLCSRVRAVDHLHHDRVDDAERDARERHPAPSRQVGAALESCLRSRDDACLRGNAAARLRNERDAAIEAHGRSTIHSSVHREQQRRRLVLRGATRARRVSRSPRRPCGSRPISGIPRCRAWPGSIGRRAHGARPATRAAAPAESIDFGREVGNDFFMGMTLGRLARMGADASDPVWARQFRDAIDLAVEHGDRRNLYMLLDVQSQALTIIGRAEPAAWLLGYVQEHVPARADSILRVRRCARDRGSRRFARRGNGSRRCAPRARRWTSARRSSSSRAELDRVIEGVASEP